MFGLGRKFRFLFTLLVVLSLLLVVFVLDSTVSRYIKQERDEIYATYTSLYFESDIKNGSVVLENNEAYFNFKLRNYVGEDITKRKVVYTITNPSYVTIDKKPITVDSKGNMTVDGGAYTGEQYVLDVWGEPQLVGSDSHNYNIQILENDGEKVDTNKYQFPYENGTEGQATSHTITVKIDRIAEGDLSSNENISIVVQLNEPYAEVFIINVKIMNHLISYSLTTKKIYETTFDVIDIQTANIFSYEEKNGNYTQRAVQVIEDDVNYIYEYTSKPFKIEYKFKGFYIEWINLNDLHIDIFDVNDTEDKENIVNNYLGQITNNKDSGSITLYAPQSSNFSVEFLKVNDTNSITTMVYVYLKKYSVDNYGNKSSLISEGYFQYKTAFGGYSDFDGVDGSGNPIFATVIENGN